MRRFLIQGVEFFPEAIEIYGIGSFVESVGVYSEEK